VLNAPLALVIELEDEEEPLPTLSVSEAAELRTEGAALVWRDQRRTGAASELDWPVLGESVSSCAVLSLEVVLLDDMASTR